MLDAVSSGTEPGYAPPDLIAQFDVHGGTAAPAPLTSGSSDLITDDEFDHFDAAQQSLDCSRCWTPCRPAPNRAMHRRT